LAGLILDLRNNAGGAVKSAVGIAAVFLKPFDKVASFEGNVGGGKSTLSAIPDDYRMASWPGDILQTLPASVKTTRMVVLVNRGTSAGAEIVGGALQDHRRAVIVGKQTFGNTSVQVMFPLKSDDGLKVTTARWLTPNGRSLASKGLVPDINVDGPESRTGDAVGSDPQLDLALRMIRAK
jgi:carboxyl-terminal processing protease